MHNRRRRSKYLRAGRERSTTSPEKHSTNALLYRTGLQKERSCRGKGHDASLLPEILTHSHVNDTQLCDYLVSVRLSVLNNLLFVCCTCMTDRFRDVCSCRDTRKRLSTQLSTKPSCHCSSAAVLYQQKFGNHTHTHISSHDMQPGPGEAAQKTIRAAGTARGSRLKSVCNQNPPESSESCRGSDCGTAASSPLILWENLFLTFCLLCSSPAILQTLCLKLW